MDGFPPRKRQEACRPAPPLAAVPPAFYTFQNWPQRAPQRAAGEAPGASVSPVAPQRQQVAAPQACGRRLWLFQNFPGPERAIRPTWVRAQPGGRWLLRERASSFTASPDSAVGARLPALATPLEFSSFRVASLCLGPGVGPGPAAQRGLSAGRGPTVWPLRLQNQPVPQLSEPWLRGRGSRGCTVTGRGKAGAPDAPGAPIRPPAAALPAGGARVPPPFPVRLELPKQGRRRGRGSPWRPHPPPLQTLPFGCHGGEAVRSDASQTGPRGVPQQPPAPCRPCPAPQALHFGVPKQTPGGPVPAGRAPAPQPLARL